MTWIEKFGAQIKRMTGVQLNISADTTEAELLSQIESVPPVSQAVESSDAFTQLQERLTAVETLAANLQGTGAVGLSAEDLTEAITAAVNPLNNQLQEVQTSVAALTAKAETDSKAFAKELNAVKLASAKADTHTPTPAPGKDGNGDDDDDDTVQMNMSQFIKGKTIVPGLNFKTLK